MTHTTGTVASVHHRPVHEPPIHQPPVQKSPIHETPVADRGAGRVGEIGSRRAPQRVRVRVVAEPEEFGGWVQAAPFRSHLLHLLAATGLPVRVLAELAGASPRAVIRLLQGRDGRPPSRIDPVLARRLYALTPEMIRDARETAVDPEVALVALRVLNRHGWSAAEVADRLRLSLRFLEALRTGRRGLVSRLVEAQLVAAAAMVDATALRAAREAIRRTPDRQTATRTAVA